MLTRLKVDGFKNLVDVDVRFGPFTCIAGANGVGKSNLFDAIGFLSKLAEKPLVDAALSVRDEAGRTGDVRNLFHRVGDTYSDEMTFEAEMIVPRDGFDDLGQPAKATITFLRYLLKIRYRADEMTRAISGLEIVREELSHIKIGEPKRHLLFPHTAQWRRSALVGRRTTPFISTGEDSKGVKIIKIHQDGGSSGRARMLAAANLPRTVLSATNAAETPTATIARREMQSWRLLQLEPSALRSPDEFTAPAKLGADGSHLAATLYRMGRSNGGKNGAGETDSRTNPVYGRLANRLSELIEDVRNVSVTRDEKRQLLTLNVTGRDGTVHPARSLSDGTLRFLALAVLELDTEAQGLQGLLCLEEPENGIHPKRIPAILDLLQDIAVEVDEPTGRDNPLRQVIVNTHSPAVVAQVPDASLLIADMKELVRNGRSFRTLSFGCLNKTWRQLVPGARVVSRGKVLEYLNPINNPPSDFVFESPSGSSKVRVIDRPDLQLTLSYGESRE
jgi:predicted ATPase